MKTSIYHSSFKFYRHFAYITNPHLLKRGLKKSLFCHKQYINCLILNILPWINLGNSTHFDDVLHNIESPVNPRIFCRFVIPNYYIQLIKQEKQMTIVFQLQRLATYIRKEAKDRISNLENITNSRKDRVGKAQLCMTDHVPPSLGIGGRDVKLCFIPYIFSRVLEKACL